MTGSLKQERAQMVCALRARGATWVEVAEAVRQRYRVNARVALRLAHGWSQDQVAELWNQRWPDDPKTHKSISYWELWPASTGHAPSLEVLRRLAELYACSVSDLSVDLGDHRHLDPAADAAPGVADADCVDPGGLLMPGQAVVLLQCLLGQPVATDDRVAWVGSPREASRLVRLLQDVDFEELARIIVMWEQLWGRGIDRREVLGKLAAAFSLAAVVPLDLADGDETQRVARFVRNPVDFDEPALRYCESMVVNLCRQGDVLGPRLTLHSVMGHRHLAEELAALAPAPFRPRALSAYATCRGSWAGCASMRATTAAPSTTTTRHATPPMTPAMLSW